MDDNLKKEGWLYPDDPEPKEGEKIEYMHDEIISEGVYVGNELVDDEAHTDMFQEIDLWRKITE